MSAVEAVALPVLAGVGAPCSSRRAFLPRLGRRAKLLNWSFKLLSRFSMTGCSRARAAAYRSTRRQAPHTPRPSGPAVGVCQDRLSSGLRRKYIPIGRSMLGVKVVHVNRLVGLPILDLSLNASRSL